MKLETYINLYVILEADKSTKEERRAFGLNHKSLKNNPLKQLLGWEELYRTQLKKPMLSQTISSYLYGITFILITLASIFGLITGVTLLSYTGHAPVNVVYFMAMVVLFPLFTMLLALLSMLKSNTLQSALVHLSPAYWLEKLIHFLPHKVQENLKIFKINPLLGNWLIIKRSQWLALFFSLGLLLALLGVVATQDIAFSWSTTLDISAQEFKNFLDAVCLPWRAYFPSAVPSLELIEQSQYFRLGDTLSQTMVANASHLGGWWKFLAMATLFYAIILRLCMILLASYGYKKALLKSFLSLKNAKSLLHDINSPVISTVADKEVNQQKRSSTHVYSKREYENGDLQTIDALKSHYETIIGWGFSQNQLTVITDTMQVESDRVLEVGGNNTIEQDSAIIRQSKKEVLLYVKAWEPPIMDFIDFLEELLEEVEMVIVCPIGIEEHGYKANSDAVDIWTRKLSSLAEDRLCVKV